MNNLDYFRRVNLKKTAFIFPGQGAQFVGMGKELYCKYPIVKETFDEANKYLGYSISDLCFEGPEEELMLTMNTQPAILATSIAILRLLNDMGIKGDYTAGLSLGEYSALVYSGVLRFEDALLLVRKRGIYMQEVVPVGRGKMGAIVGLEENVIKKIIMDASTVGIVNIANYNTFKQIVITGEEDAVKLALKLSKEHGAKKAIQLPVSAPFHCTLLETAGIKLSSELDNIDINNPEVPIISNVDAKIVNDRNQIKSKLVKQVSNSVLWLQSVKLMLDLGVRNFIEIGPGTSLSNFVKSISSELEIEIYSESVVDFEGLDRLMKNFIKQ